MKSLRDLLGRRSRAPHQFRMCEWLLTAMHERPAFDIDSILNLFGKCSRVDMKHAEPLRIDAAGGRQLERALFEFTSFLSPTTRIAHRHVAVEDGSRFRIVHDHPMD